MSQRCSCSRPRRPYSLQEERRAGGLGGRESVKWGADNSKLVLWKLVNEEKYFSAMKGAKSEIDCCDGIRSSKGIVDRW